MGDATGLTLVGIVAVVVVVWLLRLLRRRNAPGADAPDMVLKSRRDRDGGDREDDAGDRPG